MQQSRPDLKVVFDLVKKHESLSATDIMENEFGEKCFVFQDNMNCTWQIIEKNDFKHIPLRELKFELVKE